MMKMERTTLNNSIAQFSCMLSCTPNLWNLRSGRLEGKRREAVDVNAKIKTTQRYAQVTTNRISQEVDKLIQRRKEKGLTIEDVNMNSCIH